MIVATQGRYLNVSNSLIRKLYSLSVVHGQLTAHPFAEAEIPVVLLEIITLRESFLFGDYFACGQRSSVLQQYLTLDSDASLVSYARVTADSWRIEDYICPDTMVPLTALGLDLPVAEIYRKVPLPEPPARP